MKELKTVQYQETSWYKVMILINLAKKKKKKKKHSYNKKCGHPQILNKAVTMAWLPIHFVIFKITDSSPILHINLMEIFQKLFDMFIREEEKLDQTALLEKWQTSTQEELGKIWNFHQISA